MGKNTTSTFRVLFILLGVIAVIASGGSGSSSSTPPPVVTPPVVTPPVNTNFVVFLADKDTNNVVELYKYSLASGTTTKVNNALSSGANVSTFAISPDRQWIAYIANPISGIYHLFVRDAALVSAPVQLTTVAGGGGDGASSLVGDDPVWAPNSSRIAYRNNALNINRFELSTVAPTGGTPVVVSDLSNDGRAVLTGSYTWAPDSSRVAFLSDQNSATNVQLFTNAGDTAGAGNNDTINEAIAGTGNVVDYDWAPDGSRLAYLADQDVDNQLELYTALPDGTGNQTVGGVTGSPNSDVKLGQFSWAPDSSLIAFVADGNIDEVFELFVVNPATAVRTRVSRAATATLMVTGSPSWAPDSSRIAYLGDLLINGTVELFTSLPTVADTSIQVNSLLLGGNVETGQVSIDPLAWAPDSSRIAYIAQQDVVGVKEVYAGLPDGSGNSRLSGTMVIGGNAELGVGGEVWSPATTTLTLSYRADQLANGTQELWAATTTTNPQLTNTPVIPAGLMSFALWAPDGSNVIYVSEQDTAGVAELYMSSADGSTRQKISGPLVTGGNVVSDSIAWAP